MRVHDLSQGHFCLGISDKRLADQPEAFKSHQDKISLQMSTKICFEMCALRTLRGVPERYYVILTDIEVGHNVMIHLLIAKFHPIPMHSVCLILKCLFYQGTMTP